MRLLVQSPERVIPAGFPFIGPSRLSRGGPPGFPGQAPAAISRIGTTGGAARIRHHFAAHRPGSTGHSGGPSTPFASRSTHSSRVARQDAARRKAANSAAAGISLHRLNLHPLPNELELSALLQLPPQPQLAPVFYSATTLDRDAAGRLRARHAGRHDRARRRLPRAQGAGSPQPLPRGSERAAVPLLLHPRRRRAETLSCHHGRRVATRLHDRQPGRAQPLPGRPALNDPHA